MNTFLLAAVAIGLVAFLMINRRRQAAAGSAPAKERAGSRTRLRSRPRPGKIQGYPDPAREPAAAMAETAASRTLSPVMEPPSAGLPVAEPFAPPAGAAGDWGFDDMIVEPGWPMPGEMAGSFDVPTVAAPPPPPAAKPEPEAAVAAEAPGPDAPTGEWTVTPPRPDAPYGEPEPWTAASEPGPDAGGDADGEAGEPVMEAWVPGVSEVEPVVLPEPAEEPLGSAEPEPEPEPEPALVWAEPAPEPVAEHEPVPVVEHEPVPVAEPEPVVEREPVAEGVPGPPAWEPVPAPEPVAEPADEAILAVWEPVAVAAGEPVIPLEEPSWEPGVPPAEPVPVADVATHLDELADGLPLALAAVTPLLAASDHAGVTPRMAVVLRALADEPRGLPGLARALGVSRPVVADVCARLEDLGLVQRLRDPADRRRVLAVPTDRGLRLAEETEPRLDRDAMAGALGRLSAAELGALVSAVRTLRD